VQGEVDVLMENAKVMAVEVEHKVAGANAFAEQVGIEKEKVNAENGEWCGILHVCVCLLCCCGPTHNVFGARVFSLVESSALFYYLLILVLAAVCHLTFLFCHALTVPGPPSACSRCPS